LREAVIAPTPAYAGSTLSGLYVLTQGLQSLGHVAVAADKALQEVKRSCDQTAASVATVMAHSQVRERVPCMGACSCLQHKSSACLQPSGVEALWPAAG